MSFIKKLFGNSKIDDNAHLATMDIMKIMANESERVYRSMINHHNEEIDFKGAISKPSWEGISKVRLLASMYAVYMYNYKYRNDDGSNVDNIIDVAIGISFSTIKELGMEYDQIKASRIISPLIKESLLAIDDEFKTGPSKPWLNQFTGGFQKLVDLSHDALSESIGEDSYYPAVKMKFDEPIKNGILSALETVVEAFEKAK